MPGHHDSLHTNIDMYNYNKGVRPYYCFADIWGQYWLKPFKKLYMCWESNLTNYYIV